MRRKIINCKKIYDMILFITQIKSFILVVTNEFDTEKYCY